MVKVDKMLVVQSQVQQIPAPKTRVWNAFTNWYRQAKPFIGHSRYLLRKKNERDFVAVGAIGEHDFLTRVVEYLTGRIVAVRTSLRYQAKANAMSVETYCLGLQGRAGLLSASNCRKGNHTH